jgi:hypothetical protein
VWGNLSLLVFKKKKLKAAISESNLERSEVHISSDIVPVHSCQASAPFWPLPSDKVCYLPFVYCPLKSFEVLIREQQLV